MVRCRAHNPKTKPGEPSLRPAAPGVARNLHRCEWVSDKNLALLNPSLNFYVGQVQNPVQRVHRRRDRSRNLRELRLGTVATYMLTL